MSEKFYITTPIYYVNAQPHVGHAYTTIAADILARYYRMRGREVFFATGTDEHGAKIEEKAKEAGKDPKEWTDEIAVQFQMTWDELSISNDRFIRTTEDGHIRAVQEALKFMYEKGDIYLGEYEGLYCQGCEQYKNPSDLVDGKCPEHKTEPKVMKEESYMFRMSKYQNQLYDLIKTDEIKIRPIERKNEILSFYEKNGLRDISFSRKNVKWGIPLPWDEKHTAYVWSDAFLNYLTILGWNGDSGKVPEMWPANLQLMSKDILRVHATIWPAMLLSLGIKLPERLFIHGFFMIDGQKMSKSLGNVITPLDLKKKYGSDATRALLINSAPFGYDGDISWEKMDDRYNARLANGLGNLVSRVLSLTEKYLDGKVPDVNIDECAGIELLNEQNISQGNFGQNLWDLYQNYRAKMYEVKLDESWELIVVMVGLLDKHISALKLWEFIKTDKKSATRHIYALLESFRQIAWLAWPIIPETAEIIWKNLGLDPAEVMNKEIDDAMKWGLLKPGLEVKRSEPLFPRLK